VAEKIFFSPAENKLDAALQIIAVLVDRLGGEVLIERKEFEYFEDCPVVGRDYGTHCVFRLGDEDEIQEVETLPPPDFSGS
jgi:hypothetical protein